MKSILFKRMQFRKRHLCRHIVLVISGLDSSIVTRLKYSIIFYDLYLRHKDTLQKVRSLCVLSISWKYVSTTGKLGRSFILFTSDASLTASHPRKPSNSFFYVLYDIARTLSSTSDFGRYHSRRSSIPSPHVSRFRSDRNCKIIQLQILETTAVGYRKETVSDRNWLSANAIYIREDNKMEC